MYMYTTFFVGLFKPQTTTCLLFYLQAGILGCGYARPQPSRELQAPTAENTHETQQKS